MSILIVGGFGYIGSSLLNHLYNLNQNIIILDNFRNTWFNINKITDINIKIYYFDICNENELKNIFEDNDILSVIWCIDNNKLNIIDYISYYNSNIKGLLYLINFMNLYKIQNFIYLSSYEVYKYDDNIDENSICSPINPEGKLKLLTEDIIKNIYNYNYYILRLSDVIGNNIYNLIGLRLNIFNQIFIKNYSNNNNNNYYINKKIDYIHINDLCFIISKLLKKIRKSNLNKLIINISVSNNLNEIDLLKKYINNFNIIYIDDLNLNNNLLKKLIKFKPKYI